MLLKNCENGENAVYNTRLTITRDEKTVSFKFVCENSKLFCAYRGYNKFHCDGGEREKHLFALSPTMCRKFHVPEKFVFLDEAEQ